MFATTHALVGGLIASKIPSPIISYPLILASHFLLDRIPHWDLGSLVKKRKLPFVFWGGVDLLFATGLCWFIFQTNLPFSFVLWGGIFVSLLPDFLEALHFLLGIRVFPLDKFDRLHSYLFHRNRKFLLGLIPQIIIIALILSLA